VELGVYEIIPVAMKNCVVKLDEKKAASKVSRWQEIAKSAAKQSKRSLIPAVRMPMSYRQAMEAAKALDVVLIPYENERGMEATKEAIEAVSRGQSVGIFIGPEGGFATDEIEMAKTVLSQETKMSLISLGNRILRTETAGLATLSILMYHLET
jgi:16S rRNA (uracil1498-N3)-methyltransferase